MALVLHSFPFSNFCEKAAWSLDYAGLPYTVQPHLPGPHAGTIRKLSGQTSVPILQDGDQVVAGSDAIAAHANALAPKAGLIPDDLSQEVLDWQTRIDAIGATLRWALFHELLNTPKMACSVLTGGQHGQGITRYGLFFRTFCPLLRRMVRSEAPDIDQARQECVAVADQIIEAMQSDGYLVGNRFTLADLTAAAIFYPVAMPVGALGSSNARQEAGLTPWLQSWAAHPIQNYVSGVYAKHRDSKGASQP